jgi:hypothetical protein
MQVEFRSHFSGKKVCLMGWEIQYIRISQNHHNKKSSRDHKDQTVDPASIKPPSRQLPAQECHLTVYVSGTLSYWKMTCGLSSSSWSIKHNSSMSRGIISLTLWLNVKYCLHVCKATNGPHNEHAYGIKKSFCIADGNSMQVISMHPVLSH